MKSGMTSYERVMAALSGEKPDRTPVIPLIRDWASKQLGFSMLDIMNNAEKYVFSQFYCMREYGYDYVRDLAGVHLESEAMGTSLKITPHGAPSVDKYAVKTNDDVKKLRIPDPYKDGRLPLNVKIVAQLKSLCKGTTPVMCYVQAPLRNAAMLKGTDHVLRDMLKRPHELHELMEITTTCQITYANALINSGADIINISDPTSSGDMISRKQWEIFAYPYTLQLVKAVKDRGVKIIMHVCGDNSDRLDSFVSLGIDGISVDQKVDLAYARKVVGERFCLMGNVAPDNLLLSNTEDIKIEAEECIAKAGKDGSFILSSGCQMSPDTPLDSMRSLVAAAKEFRLN